MQQAVNIGIIGLGTVGAGTVKVLKRNASEISRRAGRDIRVTKAAVRDLNKTRDCDLSDIELTTDPFDVINDENIDIVVELIGGEQTACELVSKALAAGKHVVSANKALIATHGNELFAKAHEHGLMIAFEAAVAGGIPIIKALREGLAANRINSIVGIINGTGNFILSEMFDKGRLFDDVLAQAQEHGYAEADPSFDINGNDIAHKLTILAAIAFGIPLQYDKVFMQGISNIQPQDVNYARELGYRIKHLGIAKRQSSGVELRVHPTLIPEQATLSHVNGVMNAVLVNADAVGPTLYTGAGAGAEATASAVVADIIDVVRMLTADPNNRVPHLAFQPDSLCEKTKLLPIEAISSAYYLRLSVEDKPGVMADITRILAEYSISMESLLQKEKDKIGLHVPVVILTHPVLEQNMQNACEKIAALPTVDGTIISIRVEQLNGS